MQASTHYSNLGLLLTIAGEVGEALDVAGFVSGAGTGAGAAGGSEDGEAVGFTSPLAISGWHFSGGALP